VAGALALLITKIVSGMMSIPSTPATEEEWEPEDEEWEFEDEDEEEEDQPPSIPLWQRKISQKPSSEVPPVGRNDPCPCGSGKKYKHCHGQNK
jgi:preprotein translocase subunit SecA